jgi:hypothetical protein
MTFEEILNQAMALLQRQGRVSYRALKRQYDAPGGRVPAGCGYCCGPSPHGSVTKRLLSSHGSEGSRKRIVPWHGWRVVRIGLTSWRREKDQRSAQAHPLCAPAHARPHPLHSVPRLALPTPPDGYAGPQCHLSSRLALRGGSGQGCTETFLLRFPPSSRASSCRHFGQGQRDHGTGAGRRSPWCSWRFMPASMSTIKRSRSTVRLPCRIAYSIRAAGRSRSSGSTGVSPQGVIATDQDDVPPERKTPCVFLSGIWPGRPQKTS